MFTCPYCKKDMRVDMAVANVQNYGGVARVATPCCKKPVAVTRTMSFQVRPFSTDEATDSWGHEYSKGE